MRDAVHLFDLISTHTGTVYRVEWQPGYGVICPYLWTTNGSIGYFARLLCGHVKAGNYQLPQEWALPEAELIAKLMLLRQQDRNQ
jgi:hypothetical protein